MKYLVTFTEDTTISRTLPVHTSFDLIEASRPFFENLKKSEKVLDFGFFGVGRGLYAIYNVRSAAELHELTELAPLRRLCAIDSQPILDANEISDCFARVRKEVTASWDKLNKPVRDPNYNS